MEWVEPVLDSYLRRVKEMRQNCRCILDKGMLDVEAFKALPLRPRLVFFKARCRSDVRRFEIRSVPEEGYIALVRFHWPLDDVRVINGNHIELIFVKHEVQTAHGETRRRCPGKVKQADRCVERRYEHDMLPPLSMFPERLQGNFNEPRVESVDVDS